MNADDDPLRYVEIDNDDQTLLRGTSEKIKRNDRSKSLSIDREEKKVQEPPLQ